MTDDAAITENGATTAPESPRAPMTGSPPASAWKGLDTGRMPHFIGYDAAERMVAALLGRAEAWAPQAVVGIARGGLVPATMAACLLALPLSMLGWQRRGDPVRWIGPPPQASRVLLVDDCCATGVTMRAARAMLREQGIDCLTLTITHDPDTAGYVPDLSHPMCELFRFPWERGEATPAARRMRATGAPADRAYEQAFVGLDLDGVFLPDVPKAEYERDLDAALQHRHALVPFARLPHFDAGRAVVITGRLECDRAPTLAWLAHAGYDALPLELRPPDVADDPVSVARFKARAATRWGCTHFVESDPEQAIRIAAEAPHLIVSWWHADEARGWLLGASAMRDGG